jgi:hypothetical protein
LARLTANPRKTTAKNRHNRFEEICRFERRPPMQKGFAVIVASLAALAVSTAPLQAKNSGDRKAEEKPASQSCHSYVQNPDGSWTPVPCQEVGPPTHTQHKSPERGQGEDDTER